MFAGYPAQLNNSVGDTPASNPIEKNEQRPKSHQGKMAEETFNFAREQRKKFNQNAHTRHATPETESHKENDLTNTTVPNKNRKRKIGETLEIIEKRTGFKSKQNL